MTDREPPIYEPSRTAAALHSHTVPRSAVLWLRLCSVACVFCVFGSLVAAYLYICFAIGGDDWLAEISAYSAALLVFIGSTANFALLCISAFCSLQYRSGFGYLAFSILLPSLISLVVFGVVTKSFW